MVQNLKPWGQLTGKAAWRVCKVMIINSIIQPIIIAKIWNQAIGNTILTKKITNRNVLP